MSQISESRVLNIEEKIFTLHNIRDLARCIWEDYLSSKKIEDQQYEEERVPGLPKIKFFIKCFDNSSFESINIDILNDDSVINRKRIKQIKISYEYIGSKNIKLELNHGNNDKQNSNSSYINVSGDESLWVNGTLSNLNELLSSFPPQNGFLNKYKSWITGSIFVIGTLSFGFLIDLQEDGAYSPYWSKFLLNFSWNALFGQMFVGIFGGAVLVAYSSPIITKYINLLWPSVELQIGPDHKQIEKRKRRASWLILTVFILPFTISILGGILLRLIIN